MKRGAHMQEQEKDGKREFLRQSCSHRQRRRRGASRRVWQHQRSSSGRKEVHVLSPARLSPIQSPALSASRGLCFSRSLSHCSASRFLLQTQRDQRASVPCVSVSLSLSPSSSLLSVKQSGRHSKPTTITSTTAPLPVCFQFAFTHKFSVLLQAASASSSLGICLYFVNDPTS